MHIPFLPSSLPLEKKCVRTSSYQNDEREEPSSFFVGSRSDPHETNAHRTTNPHVYLYLWSEKIPGFWYTNVCDTIIMTTNPMLMKMMMNSEKGSDNTAIFILLGLVAFIVGYFILAYVMNWPPFSSSSTPTPAPPGRPPAPGPAPPAPPGGAPPPPGPAPPGSGTRPGRPTDLSAQYETSFGDNGEILLTIEIPSSSRNISNLWVTARLYWKRKAGGRWAALRSYSSKVSLIQSKFHMDTWDLPFRLFDTNDYEVRVMLWNGQPEFDSSVNDFKYSDTPHSEQVTETVTGFFVTRESSEPPPPTTGGGGLRGGH